MSTKILSIPKVLFRTATFERDCIDEEKRTVEMSISSDAPYERYFGNEILDHSAASVDMSRMKAGAPLLFNHDRSAHIGRIVEAKLDGKNLRIKAQFGNSALAKEKFADVQDGILRETSVGYQVSRMVLESEDEDEGDTYRVMRWTPFEGSLVTIPADSSVGVGRNAEYDGEKKISVECKSDVDNQGALTKSADNSKPIMPESSPATQPAATVQISSAHNDDVAAFKGRCRQINDFVKHAEKQPEWHKAVSQIAQKHMNGDADFDAFRVEALDAHPALTRVETTDKGIGMGKRDLSGYSLVRAMNCIATNRKLDGPEKDYSDQVAKDCGRDSQGFFIPTDVMRYRGQSDYARALTANVYTAAGALIESSAQGQSLIDLLRNNMMVAQMGARFIGGLKGNLAIPSQTGGATASWISENATITESNQTVGQVALSPHRLVGATSFTFQLLAQAESTDVESFVRQDLMKVLAIARDLAALTGTGLSGQPKGIYNFGTSLSTPVTLAGANSMIYADAVKFETNVATSNALQGRVGYLASIATRGNSKLVAEISAANSIPVWKNDMVNGYPAYATTQLTTLPSVIFGNWDDLIIADWGAGGNEVIVDPYSLSLQGQVRIVIQQLADIAIRHAKSFSCSST